MVEVASRGKLVVGEPYFAPGTPIALDRKSLHGAERGDLAVVSSGRGRAKVERVLGPASRIEAVLEGLLVERGARAALEPVDLGPPTGESRVDLRDLPTFTIDPDTAKDFDDAISVVRERDGVRAWVHIADVSAFVPAGSALDRGAAARAFSTYVPGLVAPMLPPELSDDACSLRPHVDRSCVTVEFAPSGEPLFYRSTICSDARLTYGQAQRRDVSAEVSEELELAAAYSAELRRRRFARGALRVERPEIAFDFDGEGGVAAARWEGEPDAHALVEELMIIANEAVAGLLAGRNREALFRVHERPDPQSVSLLVAKLADLDVPTPPVPDRLTAGDAARALAVGGRHSPRSYSARSSRPATTRATSVTPASRARPTAISRARSAVIRIWSSTARSSASSAFPTSRCPSTWATWPSTPLPGSAGRPSWSTSPTTSASPGCSSRTSSTSAGTSRGRGRSPA